MYSHNTQFRMLCIISVQHISFYSQEKFRIDSLRCRAYTRQRLRERVVEVEDMEKRVAEAKKQLTAITNENQRCVSFTCCANFSNFVCPQFEFRMSNFCDLSVVGYVFYHQFLGSKSSKPNGLDCTFNFSIEIQFWDNYTIQYNTSRAA